MPDVDNNWLILTRWYGAITDEVQKVLNVDLENCGRNWIHWAGGKIARPCLEAFYLFYEYFFTVLPGFVF